MTTSSDKKDVSQDPKNKTDILMELFQGQVVGGALSELANYSDLFLNMSEAVFLLDRNAYRVLECNHAALQLLGRPEGQVLGQELPELLGEKSFLSQKLKAPFPKAEMVYHTETGSEMNFEISASPLKILDYIEVIQFIARDVTAMKRAERELIEMNEALLQLSTTDAMTGLRNLRYFKEVMASVHHQAENFNGKYSVIFLDVDHFKKFNDRNGHPAGDEVLKKVAQILKDTARSQDLPARYGGEEFIILCRNTSEDEAFRQAETIRLAIESSEFIYGEYQPLGRVSVSMGVAGYIRVSSALKFEVTIARADQALYISKEEGRNRVTAFSSLDDIQKQKKIA